MLKNYYMEFLYVCFFFLFVVRGEGNGFEFYLLSFSEKGYR